MATVGTSKSVQLYYVRIGRGKPLLLLHGLGGSWRSWAPILPALAAEREVIAVDLPGFGETPPLGGEVSIETLADTVTAFIAEQGLTGVDAVGSSMGARLVLELARRRVVGAAIALDPGGFWAGWQKQYFALTIKASGKLVRLLQPLMPAITRSAAGRTMLFAQFSARPWQIPAAVALTEMRTIGESRSFDALLERLVNGPPQLGTSDAPRRPIVIVWGRQDRVCLPSQARKAQALFPSARLIWFDSCGHFPQWDMPDETARLILNVTD